MKKLNKKCAVLAILAQTIIRKIWIQQKLKPTAEEIQFIVKEMIFIFKRTLTTPKNIEIIINKVKIEYRCKEVFSRPMVPSIINDMIKGEAIAEVLNSYAKAMMTYDEKFDLSLEMLLVLSIRRDTECKKIKGYSNQMREIEIRDKISSKKHTGHFRNDTSTNKRSQAILETKIKL